MRGREREKDNVLRVCVRERERERKRKKRFLELQRFNRLQLGFQGCGSGFKKTPTRIRFSAGSDPDKHPDPHDIYLSNLFFDTYERVKCYGGVCSV